MDYKSTRYEVVTNKYFYEINHHKGFWMCLKWPKDEVKIPPRGFILTMGGWMPILKSDFSMVMELADPKGFEHYM